MRGQMQAGICTNVSNASRVCCHHCPISLRSRCPSFLPLISHRACTLSPVPGGGALHQAGGATRIPHRGSNLRLSGGADTADAIIREARRRRAGGDDGGGEEGDGNDLKSLAKRRAEQAKRAGSHSRDSIGKTLYRVFSSATNKLGLTVCILPRAIHSLFLSLYVYTCIPILTHEKICVHTYICSNTSVYPHIYKLRHGCMIHACMIYMTYTYVRNVYFYVYV